MPTGDFAVDDAADVEARLADEIAAKFEDHLGVRQAGIDTVQNLREVAAEKGDIQPLVAGEVRNPKAAPNVQDAHRAGRMLGEA